MLNSWVRAGAFGLGVLLMLIGVALLGSRTAEAPAGIQPLIFGAIIVVAVVLERNRYRSEAAEKAHDDPGRGGGETGYMEPRFAPTNEVFVDPTTHAQMRVWIDPRTGERRYRAEG